MFRVGPVGWSFSHCIAGIGDSNFICNRHREVVQV